MLKTTRVLAVAACSTMLLACQQKADDGDKKASSDASELSTDAQKFGYAIGVNLGQSLQPVKDHVDIDSLEDGLNDAASGKPLKLNDQQREEIHTKVAQQVQEEQEKERAEQGQKNKEDGEKFLAENAKRPEVKTTGSGLQYEILTPGEGASPTASDTVTVHYRGTLINGEEFDSSYSRGQPVTFPLSNVIPGWTEGLQLMKPGSKAKLYIPPDLAYGERGAGAKIGPNSTLIFEVELLSVNRPAGEKPEANKAVPDGKLQTPKQ
jgi:FKBP-type peptidyl-prolyl cis-trans isomerase FkpA/FKBP-type peptidyl-prolyl cis-trans isomerase FklB